MTPSQVFNITPWGQYKMPIQSKKKRWQRQWHAYNKTNMCTLLLVRESISHMPNMYSISWNLSEIHLRITVLCRKEAQPVHPYGGNQIIWLVSLMYFFSSSREITSKALISIAVIFTKSSSTLRYKPFFPVGVHHQTSDASNTWWIYGGKLESVLEHMVRIEVHYYCHPSRWFLNCNYV
jgi:hypothetical protein